MPVAAGGAKEFAADLTEAALQLPAVVGRVFAHGSSSEDEFVAEGGGNGASGFEQGFEMGLGGLLKTERGFTPVATMRVAARQEAGFGDPHAILIAAELNFREWDNHTCVTLPCPAVAVKPGYGSQPGLASDLCPSVAS